MQQIGFFIVYVLLGTVHPAFEDGTDTGFRNVGKLQFDAGEIPKRTYTIFKSRRKFEIMVSLLQNLLFTQHVSAPLCPSSGAQGLYRWLLPVVLDASV